MAFNPVEPQSHNAHATTLDRPAGGEPAGAAHAATVSIPYDCRMPVPAPSPDSRAVVTGASQGIGEALTTELAARGHHLIVTARRTEVLEELATRLAGRYGVTVEVRGVDLADPAERAELADELAGREISVLCANAGTATFGRWPSSTRRPRRPRFSSTCSASTIWCSRCCRDGRPPGRRDPDPGSAAGNSPIPNNATYAATKAFANTFSESLRGELKDSGVYVTLLAPGPVRTELPDPAEQSLVERLIPDFLWIDTEYTARISLDGMERNKMRVVPGVTSKAMSVASGYAPRAIVTPIVGAVYKKLGGD